MPRIFRTLFICTVVSCSASLAHADIFGIKSNSPNGGGDPYQYETPALLYHFPDAGGTPTAVGYIHTASSGEIRADGLAWSASLGMYVFEISGPDDPVTSILRPLNSTNALAGAAVATYTNRHIFGAAFDTHNNLWAMDEISDQLLRINPLDGQILQTINLTFDGDVFDLAEGAGDVAFDAAGNAWLTYKRDFYTVNMTDGVMSLHYTAPASISLWSVGAVFSPVDPSQLYVFDVSILWNNDDLLAFDVDAGFARTDVSLKIFNQNFNAGRGDLAAMMVPEPTSLVPLTIAALALPRRRHP